MPVNDPSNLSAAPLIAAPNLSPVTVRVRTYELDSFGHVNNSVYLNYLEEARSEFLKQMGLSFHDLARHGVQLVIAEVRIRYISPARYGDDIQITGRFRDIRAASLYIDYTLTDRATGRILADAETRGAFVDAVTGRPMRAPRPFFDAFTAAANAAVSAG